MRSLPAAVLFALVGAGTLPAQNPDSLARARADSIRLVRELESMRRRDTVAIQPQFQGRTGPINPRLLPDISAVGDLIGDFSPKGSTQEDRSRFSIREIEVAIQAVVDPYFRGDIFLGVSDLEKISIEQAVLTFTSLPWHLDLRAGRFLMPVGKQNTTHRHDLHTVDHSYVVQRFLGEESLKGTGIYLARVFAPLGFYQELILTATERFGEAPEDLVAAEPPSHRLSGLGYSARLRNYWDLSEASNLELSASAITGRRETPLEVPEADVNATLARQTVGAVDLTFRWRPLQQGLYRSFILQGEVMKQFNPNPARNYTGAYGFARYQLSRRGYLGARYDWLQDPEQGGVTLNAGTLLYEYFPSEFSKLVAAVERRSWKDLGGTTRFLLQAAFALGPHKPHPF
jgi:hypothetical protein